MRNVRKSDSFPSSPFTSYVASVLSCKAKRGGDCSVAPGQGASKRSNQRRERKLRDWQQNADIRGLSKITKYFHINGEAEDGKELVRGNAVDEVNFEVQEGVHEEQLQGESHEDAEKELCEDQLGEALREAAAEAQLGTKGIMDHQRGLFKSIDDRLYELQFKRQPLSPEMLTHFIDNPGMYDGWPQTKRVSTKEWAQLANKDRELQKVIGDLRSSVSDFGQLIDDSKYPLARRYILKMF